MIYLELFLTFGLAVTLIVTVKMLSGKYHLIDTPNERSVHETPIPTSGGVGIVFSVLIVFVLFHEKLALEFFYPLLAFFLVFLVGLFDDLKDISPKQKLLGIALAAVLLCADGYRIESLGTFGEFEIGLPWLLSGVFTCFAVVGFTNALNLIDGVDGLAASISLVILCALLVIGLQFDDEFIITFSSLLIVAIVAFLLFNWHPASIFMGDSGALALGFAIAVLCIKSLEYITPTSVLFFTAIPLLDTMIVLYRRIQRHRSPFSADKIHLHHLILMQKDDTRFTVISLALMQVVLAMIGYSAIYNNDLFNLVHFAIIHYIYFTFFDQRVRRRNTH